MSSPCTTGNAQACFAEASAIWTSNRREIAQLLHANEVSEQPPMALPSQKSLRQTLASGPWVTLPFTQCGGKLVSLSYLHIWKSGGHTVMASLHNAFLNSSRSARAKFGARARETFLESTRRKEGQFYTSLSHGPIDNLRFTFFREPEERFVSGYTEMSFRTHNRTQQGLSPEGRFPWKGLAPIGTLAHARDFVQAFVSAGPQVNDHVALQAGALSHAQFDYIGNAAALANDWKQAMRYLLKCNGADVPPLTQWPPGGHHSENGSSDPLNTTAAMQTLLNENPHVRKALRLALASDYRAFEHLMARWGGAHGGSPELLA